MYNWLALIFVIGLTRSLWIHLLMWMPTQLNLNGSNNGAMAPSSAFFGSSLKKITQKLPKAASPSVGLSVRAMADDEEKQTNKDKWRGLAYDTSDDQQDITRGKGMVDSLFQAPMDAGTHYAVMSSYDYISTGLRQ